MHMLLLEVRVGVVEGGGVLASDIYWQACTRPISVSTESRQVCFLRRILDGLG